MVVFSKENTTVSFDAVGLEILSLVTFDPAFQNVVALNWSVLGKDNTKMERLLLQLAELQQKHLPAQPDSTHDEPLWKDLCSSLPCGQKVNVHFIFRGEITYFLCNTRYEI